MIDQQTIDVYNTKAEDYANMPESSEHHTIKRFCEHLPASALVLDLGCGHGVNSAYFRDQGAEIEAWDISEAMQKVALQRFGISVVTKGFSDLKVSDCYDGICVNYSLLHIEPSLVPEYLAAICRALKAGGLLHLGMKLGEGTERDHLGRFYAYYPEQQLKDWLTDLGLSIEYSHKSVFSGLAGNPQTGIAIHARKPI